MVPAVRVRFAPSPTGFLHIGGVRTALFNYLYAKKYKGTFLLRIEDTDTERSEDRYTQDILSGLRWLGLHWDEELVFQSKRWDLYRRTAQELIDRNMAYRCYCSEEEVEAMRQEAMKKGQKPKYNGKCRERKDLVMPGERFVVRAKLPEQGSVKFEDLIHGSIEVQNSELDDFVLIRSAGAPTYNFTAVIDDIDMKISHVIRGDDHINNTPRQVHLYEMLRATPPKFAHLPMILGSDKKKLSKRNGDVSSNWYRGEGYMPEAVTNFLARLGWSHGDQEVFSMAELCGLFDFDHVQKSAAVFNSEKLLWLNGEHIRNAHPQTLLTRVQEDFADFFKGSPVTLERLKSAHAIHLVKLIQPKVKLLKDMAMELVSLCSPGVLEVDPSSLKWNKNPELKTPLQKAASHLHEVLGARASQAGFTRREGTEAAWGQIPTLAEIGFTHDEMGTNFKMICDQHGVKLGDLMQPIRLCLTGQLTSSAGMYDLIPLLPWDVIDVRLRKIASL